MDTVCMILNLQGFQVGSNDFHARELGYAAITSPDTGCISFDLGGVYSSSEESSDSISYCRRRLHGLSLLPRRGERPEPHKTLHQHVARLYSMYCRDGIDVVAFKGGINEKKLLGQLGIPYVDLEQFGCPVIKILKDTYGPAENASFGLHDTSFQPAIDRVPCAMAKVKLLRNWLMDKVECQQTDADECLEKIKSLMAEKKEIERQLKDLEKKLDDILQW